MKDYYAEFLQRKISENIPDSEVSKVSKGQNKVEKPTFDTFDTALPDINQKNFFSDKAKPSCSNCDLQMNLIENGKLWFCPLGCESRNAR